jgi:EAL domain-containing protein (putative c-di-GMP-specific phosphodiesterase class I)
VSDNGLGFELERAITENELVLHYQPRVIVETLALRGVEALVRWRHPTRGILAPGAFVDAAEGVVMRDLEAWVIRETLLQASVWRRDGMRIGVSVNIAPALLRDEPFLRTFERVLKIQGDPTTLVLELAATSLHAETPREGLLRLREHGVRLALDDVTAPAQLDAAGWIRWDYVKLGRALVGSALTDPGAGRRLGALVDQASALGVRIVGMGVEDDATMTLLRELGVFLAQGYLIARPLGVQELAKWAEGRARPV